MKIRPYRDADLETIKAITVEAFDGVSIDHNIDRRFGPIAGHDWKWRKGRHVDADVSASNGAVFVAEEAGEILGCITTRLDREAGVGLIPNIAVHPAGRGKGIGRALIEHALAHFRAEGLTVARIETLDQNPIGRHLYPSCGFVEVAKQVHFAMDLTTS